MKDFHADIEAAVETLRRGGVVVYPTDTVWGIGCDATDAAAVARIYAIKQRDDSKALLTLMTPEMLDVYLPDLPETCREEMLAAERPTTVICPSARGVAPNLLAEDGSLGVRLTGEEFSQTLCRRLGKPIVSTSVNISGQPAPAVFAEINPSLLAEADYVAFCRRDDETRTAPSRIVRFDSSGNKTIIRP